MTYLITGGCGFLGSNLSAEVIRRKEKLFIIDNFTKSDSAYNLSWLKLLGKLHFVKADIRNERKMKKVIKDIKPDVIFHLAGQVAMSASVKKPKLDFEINAKGSLNILEAVRLNSAHSIIIYSSTNKVYGDLEYLHYDETPTRFICKEYPDGFDETLPLNFQTPYGCSKGAADQYMLDYAGMYGLKTVVFRHSSIYGGRQFPTYDQGWVSWFCKKAIEAKEETLKEPFTICGSGKQVRDILYIDDAVNCYFRAIDKISGLYGEKFNIGGGKENSLSILEFFSILDKELDIQLRFKKLPFREKDQKYFVANIDKAKKNIDWYPHVGKTEGIRKTIGWIRGNSKSKKTNISEKIKVRSF